MIVFDLRCGGGHVFEAWFGSSAAYADQVAAGLVQCPICGDAAVEKAVMAPNVAAKGNRTPAANGHAPAARDVDDAESSPERAAVRRALAAIAQAQADALKDSRWVGARFSAEARAMHAGDAPAAAIHGRATIAEARALVEDGVPVAPLLVPVVPPEERN